MLPKYILLAILLCLSQAVAADGDPVAGERKALICQGCHGKGGNSTNPTFPKLAGQNANYIIRASIEFQNGIRLNPMMSGISTILKNPQDMEDIAAYLSSQPPMKGQPTSSALAKKGEQLFTSGRCNYCHGEGGKHYAPFMPVVPVIGGQHKEYLIRAIKDIRDDKRPGDIYDLMKNTVKEMSDHEIEAIAEYLSGL